MLVRAGWCALLVRVARAGWCPGWKWLPAYLETRVPGSCPGWCGYLHALNLVSLVRVPCWFVCPWLVCPWLVCPGSCALLVRVARVVVGSDYLHALNLVSLVRVSLLVGAGWCGYLHALNLVSLVGVSLVGSCPGWK